MKRITRVVVTHEDGSQRTYLGSGAIHEVHTEPKDTPKAQEGCVRYININLELEKQQ